MKRTVISGFIVVLVLASLFAADDKKANVLLQAALAKETIQGDLKGAIELYQQVVKEAVGNRALAAQAQLRVGVLYERLGRTAEAQQAYQAVVTRHATQQQAVADARTRLTAIGGKPIANTGPILKLVWTAPLGADIEGVMSPDGRYVPYGKDNALYLHDLTTGTDRRLTDPVATRDYVDETMFSRGGKELAFSWFKEVEDRSELRVVSLQGTGVPRARQFFDNENLEWIGPFDWSPDGKSIVVQLQRKDGTEQMGLVAVEDGSLRMLKSVDWRISLKMFFSPDGRYLAFDRPASDTNPRRDVFVMTVDGSREIPVMVNAASHDTLVGWSPDGTHLLVASDRTGVTALWQLPFINGVVEGQPELLNRDLGKVIPMGVSKTGALYFERLGGRSRGDIQLAEFDLSTGRLLSQPVPAAEGVLGTVTDSVPDWSPDGKYLAYTSERSDFGRRNFLIAIRSIETGQVREIAPNPIVNFFQGARWWPDGQSFVAAGINIKGRWGVFRIDAQTGHTSPIFLQEPQDGATALAVPSPDGTAVYYRRRHPAEPETVFVKRDLASGRETALKSTANLVGLLNLSPDGRYIATPSSAAPPNPNTMLLIPTDGGETRELAGFGALGRASMLGWASDSRSMFLWKNAPGAMRELWRVFLDGRDAVKMDTNLPNTGRAVPSPDGRHVALQVGSPGKPSEVWVLENFLPALKASR